MIQILKMAAVLIASAMIGNWFMVEQKKNKARGLPWYRVYWTIPGMIIAGVILILPFILVAFNR